MQRIACKKEEEKGGRINLCQKHMRAVADLEPRGHGAHGTHKACAVASGEKLEQADGS
jgi:hypothetical protein